MLSKLRSRLTYANVMATIAVFIALGGSSYAAIKVTGKNVKDSSLTGRDIKNNSVTGKDIKGIKSGDVANRSLLAKDFKTGQLPAGPKGDKGDPGPFPDGDLPSGKTIRGHYGVVGGNGVEGYAGISFGYTLSARPAIRFIPAGGPVPSECAGGTIALPQALPGNLCVFEDFRSGGTAGAVDPDTFDNTHASRVGALASLSDTGSATAEGSWAVTAP